MQILNLLKKYVVDSQFFVALCGTLFAVFFMLEKEMLRWPTILLVFITFWSGYLYTKFQHHRYFRRVLVLNVLAGIFCGVLIHQNHNEIRLIKWMVIVFLGLLYNSFFLEKFVRKIPLLKVFYVGLTWALINSWLILNEFSWPIFFISLFYITALVLPFDIRDVDNDEVITFPKLIGIENTKFLAYLLIFVAVMIAVFCLKTQYAGSFLLASAFSFVLIYFSDNRNRDSYFSFWVEICSALPFLFVILLQYF